MDMIQRQSNNQSIYSYPNGGGTFICFINKTIDIVKKLSFY